MLQRARGCGNEFPLVNSRFLRHIPLDGCWLGVSFAGKAAVRRNLLRSTSRGAIRRAERPASERDAHGARALPGGLEDGPGSGALLHRVPFERGGRLYGGGGVWGSARGPKVSRAVSARGRPRGRLQAGQL